MPGCCSGASCTAPAGRGPSGSPAAALPNEMLRDVAKNVASSGADVEGMEAYGLQVPMGGGAEGAVAAVGEGGGGLVVGRKRHSIVPRAAGNAGAGAVGV